MKIQAANPSTKKLTWENITFPPGKYEVTIFHDVGEENPIIEVFLGKEFLTSKDAYAQLSEDREWKFELNIVGRVKKDLRISFDKKNSKSKGNKLKITRIEIKRK